MKNKKYLVSATILLAITSIAAVSYANNSNIGLAIAFGGFMIYTVSAIYGWFKRAKTNKAKKKKSLTTSCEANGKYTILIADDSKEIVAICGIVLERAGYKVTKCSNGQEAILAARDSKFDTMLIDINMPGVDGYEAMREIRKDSLNKKTVAVALTAESNIQLANKHIEAGFDQAMQKPLKPSTLLRKVNLITAGEKQISDGNCGKEIMSSLTEDSDYKQTIEMFVSELPERINSLQKTLEQGQFKAFAKQVHALKGLGGFAGFPIYTEKAKDIEGNIRADKIDEIRQQVNDLIRLCNKTKIVK